MSVILFLLFYLIPSTVSHVTWTFPEARYPPLDFLDTARTVGPCGVPKSDRSTYTTLKTGTKYNVTWRLQYPHQGGFRISLIDYLGNQVEQLAPPRTGSEGNSTSFDGLQDQSLEDHQIKFDSICPNCTLVLERQALEWGPSYKFKSCAEVHVVEIDPSQGKDCMGRGKRDDTGYCECNKGYSGDLCQYQNDCDGDKDCWNGGRCIANGIFPNKKSCFCQYGWHGKDCRDRSGPLFIDDTCFNYNETVDTTDFKYNMYNPKCYKEHQLTKDDLLYSRVLKDELEVILDFKTESYVALGWRPTNIPRSCRLFPNLDNKKEESSQTAGYAKSALDASLHGMDCTDIIMASVVHGDFLHIEDMYTRDRSTPISDNILDGEQSLTTAYGIQRNERTIVMFRRGIREIEPSDHPLGPGEMHFIHAKGQQQGSYKHFTPSALEKNNVSVKDFYKDDQWRYHGSENRGVHRIELVSPNEMTAGKSFLLHKVDVLERPHSDPSPFRDEVIPRPQASSTSTSVVIVDLEKENENTSETFGRTNEATKTTVTHETLTVEDSPTTKKSKVGLVTVPEKTISDSTERTTPEHTQQGTTMSSKAIEKHSPTSTSASQVHSLTITFILPVFLFIVFTLYQ
ncbi:unnamed protein product [Bursaphelenchus xylophilus]|uniref:(pine wood nematode) hypothetical protein n=1 Tax=Bursaphelenchus xylophilus TaxID=6326 RepID=A0A1I7RHK7_BURXY|nr:unnamed protein product [Bursaphelenchus xylophilus]CAG9115640.1 unnamed protein product [Bursaphelenchus xylophilus]